MSELLSIVKVKDIRYIKEKYKKIEKQNLFMTYYDTLTGLPNKNYLLNKLKGLIARERMGVLICLDIDNFKEINDSFGYNYGDVLLKLISQLITCCIKDQGITSRNSSDNFMILLPDITEVNEINKLCNSIMDNFMNPFEIMDVQTYCSLSMGIAFIEKDTDEIEVLKSADIAMHYAKTKGKNKYIYYDKNLEELITRKKNIENNLQNALDNNELELYYQPQVDIKRNKIKGFEALIRWNSPKMGLVMPNDFIPIAEETGLIFKIGEWVIKEALSQAKEWKDKSCSFDTISINISPKQIKYNHFTNFVKSELLRNGLTPETLELEITETVLIKSIEELKLLNRMSDGGIRISIDDFGKGYSSLNYLTNLPIKSLKIDKSFIDKLCEDKKTFYVVECIIELSRKLNFYVIAEGVESIKQAELLKKIGCDCIQGYYYGKPEPAGMAEDFLKSFSYGKEVN